MNSTELSKQIHQLIFDNETPVAFVLDIIIEIVERKDFVLAKPYSIKTTFDMPQGKWQNVVKDSVYLDSR